MIKVQVIPALEWKKFSENAHLVAFNEVMPAEREIIDFALLASSNGNLLGYVTCKEFNADTIYWQYGGTFPGARKTSLSWLVYTAGLNWCTPKYKRIVTFIENTNTVMLKFALRAGFLIEGIRINNKCVFLEHVLEKKHVV